MSRPLRTPKTRHLRGQQCLGIILTADNKCLKSRIYTR